AIGTLVERTTRFTILLHVDAARRSVTTRDALVTALGVLPAPLRTSITWDQGWELALRERITAALGTAIYFCEPHSPWQRGTNENTNRLLRDCFSKRTDLGIHTPQRLADVAAELNDRPRQVLDGDTPPADSLRC
ncbi:MAG: IS30 family transposase, partial [Allobranchiibius sp.]